MKPNVALLYEAECRSEVVVRHRFISYFKRGVRHMPTDKDNPWIERGNATAPYGNCFRDAHLYKSGSRNDSNVFQDLDGLPGPQGRGNTY